MAERLKIKGLGETVAAARAAIADVRGTFTALHSETVALQMDAQDVRDQIKQHHDDLKFEVSTLGNAPSAVVNSAAQSEIQNESSPEPADQG